MSLAGTWLINNRINLQLLGQLNDAQLAYSASPARATSRTRLWEWGTI